jgi:hypothetical protein
MLSVKGLFGAGDATVPAILSVPQAAEPLHLPM